MRQACQVQRRKEKRDVAAFTLAHHCSAHTSVLVFTAVPDFSRLNELQLYAMAVEGEFILSYDALAVDGILLEPANENRELCRCVFDMPAPRGMPARGEQNPR